VKSPTRWGVALVLTLTASFGPAYAQAIVQSPHSSKSGPEFSQSVRDLEKGQVFATSGLVCDRPSEVDAVITLARKGEVLQKALDQINAGAKMPRCIMGRMLIAQYKAKARTFSVNDQPFYVHEVDVIGVAIRTPRGVVPIKLGKPMKQYVVSTQESVPA